MTSENARVGKTGLSRRNWTTLLAIAPFVSQVASTPQNPPPLTAPTAEQGTAKAAANVRKVSDRLAETEVPMALEPAITFRA